MEFQFSREKIVEPSNLLRLRSRNDIEFHFEQLRRKGQFSILDMSSSNLDVFENEILEELKNAKYNALEYMVYRMQLTHDEIMDLLEQK